MLCPALRHHRYEPTHLRPRPHTPRPPAPLVTSRLPPLPHHASRSVKALADSLLSSATPLHVLINNAGVLAPGPFTVTPDGFELWVPVAS